MRLSAHCTCARADFYEFVFEIGLQVNAIATSLDRNNVARSHNMKSVLEVIQFELEINMIILITFVLRFQSEISKFLNLYNQHIIVSDILRLFVRTKNKD